MKKSSLLAAIALACASPVAAQQIAKLDGALSRAVTEQRAGRSATAAMTAVVRCADADALARLAAPYESRIVMPTLLVLTAPPEALARLAESPLVESMQTPVQYTPAMTEARALTGVDPIHTGDGLVTPFTGRGVVLGVIDQGFEYRHPAFLDSEGNSRVRAIWNRSVSLETKPLTTIPAMGDKGGGGHATHVTNIAAGSDTGNRLHGVAPEAEIIMVPSPFLDYEVLEDVQWIKKTAESEGKPWVVNMSFGTTIGPHDGTGGCCSEISQLTGAGGVIVAAMGNEGGEALHVGATLQPGDTKYVLCKGGESGFLFVDFWADDPDAQRHISISPFTYANYKMDAQDDDFWQRVMPADVHTGSYSEINPVNQKLHERYIIDMEATAHGLQTSYSTSKSLVGFKVELAEGETEPHGFHAWIGLGHGKFSTVSISGQKANMLTPDSRYLVAEGSACIPAAIAVASCNSNVRFASYKDGALYDYTRYVGAEGAVSSFSNSGPWLGSGFEKPLVAAPGAIIKSAVSKLADGFSPTDPTIVDRITDARGNEFYYSAMQGTSMASPFVAGAVCLWLEANPELSPADVAHIIRSTSVVDPGFSAEFASDADGVQSAWSPRAGYGRIDVYEGLKMALQMGDDAGIARVDNSLEPFTLSMSGDTWRILFNNAERSADLILYTTDGRLVVHRRLAGVRQGEEHTLSLAPLSAGTYVLRLATGRATMTRRVVVR